MPKIQLRDNVAYDWLGQTREGGETYEMDEGEAEYVQASGFVFDPKEEVAPVLPPGRFSAAVAKSKAATVKKG